MPAHTHAVCALLLAVANAAAQVGTGDDALPVVVVTADNTEITRSCAVEIPPGVVIADADGNGVIHIRTDGITVTFKGDGELWGGARPKDAPTGPWDGYTGIGIRIDGADGVTIRGVSVHGYKVGIWATGCDDLRIEGTDLSDNYRQKLKSTPESEDSSDWLFPHHNDKDEWAIQHGAGVYVRGGMRPVITGVRVRRGQNGILLHSVGEGWVHGNDCSFLSGWGLGMFRSSGNRIERNAFDFCVRGHSEGRYNRGQDSAGVLIFEQCSDNLLLENSCTHGGDGVFGFAGLEAVNGEGVAEGYDFARRGCNDNIFAGNDLSYAAAHGLEMTFSFGNRIVQNRFVENAICGVWGGYSQDTLISGNEFTGNGGMAYGMERGGVNIEHGAGNVIAGNDFLNNRCGVHIWWDEHAGFESKAWGKANYKGVAGNIIADNRFTIDGRQPFGRVHPDRPLVALHIRDEGAQGHITKTVFARNAVSVDPAVGVERLAPDGLALATEWNPARVAPSLVPAVRSSAKSPVGARAQLRGRQNIIMNEWGPWDHITPMIRLRRAGAEAHVYEFFGARGPVEVSSGLKSVGDDGPRATARVETSDRPEDPTSPVRIVVAPVADRSGVFPYRFRVRANGVELPIEGQIVAAAWQLTCFPWTDGTDPRTNLEGWRGLAAGPEAFSVMAAAIDFDYGHGGPKDQKWAGPVRAGT